MNATKIRYRSLSYNPFCACRFYNDPVALDVDRQFLWGGGLLISPVLAEGQRSVDAYFPIGPDRKDRWFSFYDGFEVELDGVAKIVTVDAPMDVIPLHIRGGHILPTQEHANTTVYRWAASASFYYMLEHRQISSRN